MWTENTITACNLIGPPPQHCCLIFVMYLEIYHMHKVSLNFDLVRRDLNVTNDEDTDEVRESDGATCTRPLTESSP